MNEQESQKVCLVKNIETTYLNKNILGFGFVRESTSIQDLLDGTKFREFISYEPDGHWLTKVLFGYKINFINDYTDWFSCVDRFRSQEISIKLRS